MGRLPPPGGVLIFKTPLVGVHNVENILSATGVAAALNIAPATIKAGIEALSAIPGRLEPIENTPDDLSMWTMRIHRMLWKMPYRP